MRIGIVGGTGKEGAGLGVRWAVAGHEVVIGSRDAERARGKAAELAARAPGARVAGMSNRDAVAAAEVVVLAVPATGLAATLPEVREACRGKIVVSTVVPLTFGGGRLFTPPAQGSSAEEAQELLGPDARVVAAFHHIAAHELAAGDHAIECDLLLCGGDAEAKRVVTELGASMGLRAVDVGALYNAGPLEGITAVLATINRRYKLKNSGIKITGLPELAWERSTGEAGGGLSPMAEESGGDTLGVGEVLEQEVGLLAQELLAPEPAGGHGHRDGPEGARAVDVVRRVADHEHVAGPEGVADQRVGPAGRQ